MAGSRGKRARTKGGRLSLAKKRRVGAPAPTAAPEPSPPSQAAPPPDTSSTELEALNDRLRTCVSAGVLPCETVLSALMEALRVHGAGRVLSIARSAPRALLLALESGAGLSTSHCRAVAQSLASLACAKGDDETILRARSWAAQIAADAARGARGAKLDPDFAHGAPAAPPAVAPRDALDAAALTACADAIVRQFASGVQSEERIRTACASLAAFADVQALRPALEAVLLAANRVSAPFSEGLSTMEEEGERLPVAVLQALLPAAGPRPFDGLCLPAKGAVLVLDENALSAERVRVTGLIEKQLFVDIDSEEALALPVATAAAHDLHTHWELLAEAENAASTGEMHPFVRRTWPGRRAHRAFLSAAFRACEADKEEFLGMAVRLPRKSRALANSFAALGRACYAVRDAGKPGIELVRNTILSSEESTVLLSVEHAIETIVIAAGALNTGSSCKEVLGGAEYGLRAAFMAGKVAGGNDIGDDEISKEAKDPIAAAELVRSLMLAEKYSQWADHDRLRRNAVRFLDECANVHRRDSETCRDIAGVVQWWQERIQADDGISVQSEFCE